MKQYQSRLCLLSLPLAFVCAAACGGTSGSGFGNPGNEQDSGTSGKGHDSGSTVPPLGGTDAGDILGDGSTAPPGNNCSAASQLVYVIDTNGVLYSFDPSTTLYEDAGPPAATTAFKKLGTPACNWGGGGPNSMAVDRNAVAWICDNDGSLFEVDTANANNCTKTPFKKGQSGWGKFGMGFSTDTAGGTTDTLYVVDNESTEGAGDSLGLGSINLTTWALTPIGAFSGNGGAQTGHDCELTGTGNAQLYGFFFQQSSSVNQLNTSNAAVLTNASVSVNLNMNAQSLAWAFSFWGGDFYLYTYSSPPDQSSNVTRYRPSDGSSTQVLSNIGFDIVGAGVSTCAPTTIPPVK